MRLSQLFACWLFAKITRRACAFETLQLCLGQGGKKRKIWKSTAKSVTKFDLKFVFYTYANLRNERWFCNKRHACNKDILSRILNARHTCVLCKTFNTQVYMHHVDIFFIVISLYFYDHCQKRLSGLQNWFFLTSNGNLEHHFFFYKYFDD